jgi:hypothetical protein
VCNGADAAGALTEMHASVDVAKVAADAQIFVHIDAAAAQTGVRPSGARLCAGGRLLCRAPAGGIVAVAVACCNPAS